MDKIALIIALTTCAFLCSQVYQDGPTGTIPPQPEPRNLNGPKGPIQK